MSFHRRRPTIDQQASLDTHLFDLSRLRLQQDDPNWGAFYTRFGLKEFMAESTLRKIQNTRTASPAAIETVGKMVLHIQAKLKEQQVQ